MDGIGIGLIGAGFMGKCHALAFGAVKAVFGDVPRPKLEVLCEISLAKAQAAAAQFGFDRATDDWRALVEDPKVDLVSVTTPNALHHEMALAAIAAGKHVYCEKPMAVTLGQAEAMADAAVRSPVRTLVGYNYLKNPAVLHARALLDRGAIGRPIHFRGIFDEDYMADPALPGTWRSLRREAGLGVLGDMGCHLVAAALYLAGPIESVVADTRTVYSRHYEDEDGSGGSGESGVSDGSGGSGNPGGSGGSGGSKRVSGPSVSGGSDASGNPGGPGKTDGSSVSGSAGAWGNPGSPGGSGGSDDSGDSGGAGGSDDSTGSTGATGAGDSGSGPFENEDVATALVRFANGCDGSLAMSRSAWGRKNRLAWEIHGEAGMLVFDQERMNELRLYQAGGPAAEAGFKTILTGSAHPPYGEFVPAPGHGLGFNEQKVIEARHLLAGIAADAPVHPDFAAALEIERIIYAIDESGRRGTRVRLLPASRRP